MLPTWKQWLPGLAAMPVMTRQSVLPDIVAGLITGMVLIPQAVAFAQLAGLPSSAGLAASVLPMIAYALLGSSRTLSVGPVSVASLMVAAVLAQVSEPPMLVASILAVESGVFLLLLVALRLHVLARVFSHPVLGGFTVGAAILIVLSQAPALTGAAKGALMDASRWLNAPTLVAGLASLAALWTYNNVLAVQVELRCKRFLGATAALIASRAGPVLLIAATGLALIVSSTPLQWPVVGAINGALLGVDVAAFANFAPVLWWHLFPSAVLIAIVGYVESLAVAETLAQRRRETIDPRQELIALGASNLVASITGAMPIAGGLSRSMVNFAGGARTQFAAVVSAFVVLAFVSVGGDLFAYLPKFALAAIIIVAVLPLIAFGEITRLLRTDLRDALVWLTTAGGVLALGLEGGLLLGAAIGLIGYLERSIRPHVATLGRVPGTEHFRNIGRHAVEQFPGLLLLRFDDAISFLNAPHLREFVARSTAIDTSIKHVVLSCAAVNHVDSSGTHILHQMAQDLKEIGVGFHLAEVKGPVQDAFVQVGFGKGFHGATFLSLQAAVAALHPLTIQVKKAEPND